MKRRGVSPIQISRKGDVAVAHADLADLVAVVALAAHGTLNALHCTARDNHREADAHVVGPEHLGIERVGGIADHLEDRQHFQSGEVHDRVHVLGEDAAEVAFDTAARDVGHAVQAAVSKEPAHGLVVARVGFEDGIEEGFLARHFLLRQLGIITHEFACQRVTVGMESVAGDGEDLVALPDLAAVDDHLLFHDADDARTQNVGAVRDDARLLGGFAAGEHAALRLARIGHAFDQAGDHVFIQLAAHDAVLHREGSGSHHDDVIEQVVDQVLADGFHFVVIDRELLLAARLFGLEDEDGVLVSAEPAVKETGERAHLIEHALIVALERGFHRGLGGIGFVDIHAGCRVGQGLPGFGG